MGRRRPHASLKDAQPPPGTAFPPANSFAALKDPVEGEDDVGRVERLAVMELDPRTQMEGPGFQVMDRLPVRGADLSEWLASAGVNLRNRNVRVIAAPRRIIA
jgi:hypothetical protein